MARTIWSAGRPRLLVVVVGAAVALAACSGAAPTVAPASAAASASTSTPSPVASPSAEASIAAPVASAAASTKAGGRYGSGGSGASPAAGATTGNAVTVVDFGFTPETINVKVGTTVTWTNTGVTHTVTADKGLFDSGPFKAGETFSFTFATSGTFAYHCAIHSSMRGTITASP